MGKNNTFYDTIENSQTTLTILMIDKKLSIWLSKLSDEKFLAP